MKRFGLFILFLAVLMLTTMAVGQPGEEDGGHALLLDIKGAIGPATRDYVVRGLDVAAKDRAEIVILRIDTPGGLDASTRDIVSAILNSPVPVATFVSPQGARAASAGTYILLASHIAAMSPATHVGAATPVSIIGGSSPGQGEDRPDASEEAQSGQDQDEGEVGDSPDGEGNEEASQESESSGQEHQGDAMSRKVLNDAVAYIRGLASRHGRNADWAERAVREAHSITSEEALDLQVIDLIVTDVESLLSEIDGMTVELADGEAVLATKALRVVNREPDWRNELLAVLTDPTIAYILLLIGFYGLVLEGYHPGAIVPGVVGAISLLLALYALQMLPVNYAGLALIILGIILIVAETIAPSFGALGIGGVIALVIGSIILMDTEVPGFEVSRTLIGSIALVSSALLLAVAAMAMRARYQPIVSGREILIGMQGTAAGTFRSQGAVYVAGERWRAVTSTPLMDGQGIEVTAIDGLTLSVRPVNEPTTKEHEHV